MIANLLRSKALGFLTAGIVAVILLWSLPPSVAAHLLDARNLKYSGFGSSASSQVSYCQERSTPKVETNRVDPAAKDAVDVRKVWAKSNDGGDFVKAYMWFPSPSGKYIVVLTQRKVIPIIGYETDLELLSTANGSARPLTEDGLGYDLVRWHQNGNQIAYISQQGHYLRFDQEPHDADIPWTVYVQNIISGTRTRLFQESPVPNYILDRPVLEWIPHRNQLLYSSHHSNGLFLLGADGAKPERLAKIGPAGIVTTANLTYWRDDSKRRIRIARLPAQTAAWTKPEMWQKLKPFAAFIFPRDPMIVSFSHSGQVAVLIPLSEGETNPRASQLIVVDPVTRQAHPLGVVPAEWSQSLSWTDDGKHLTLAQSDTPDEDNRRRVDVNSAPQQSFDKLDWTSRSPALLQTILPEARH